MAELERLKQLNEYDTDTSFSSTGVEVQTGQGRAEIRESDLFEATFESVSTLYLAERNVQLPGMVDSKELIRGAVKKFTRDVIESNFRTPAEAGVDDVTMQQIRPETFNVDNFDNDGLTAGSTTQVVDDGSGNPYALDDDEWVIVTDLVEYNSDHPITAVQFTIDGKPKEAQEIRPQVRNSDLQIYPLDTPQFAKEEIQLQAKAEDAGDSDLTPHGVHIAKGDIVGDLS